MRARSLSACLRRRLNKAASQTPWWLKIWPRHTSSGTSARAFGHLGDGNLHYNVQAPAGADAKAFLRDHEASVNTIVYDSVACFDGSISAEHGVGSLKLDKLEQHKSPVALGMMRAIKQALDPHNTLNPGRVLRA